MFQSRLFGGLCTMQKLYKLKNCKGALAKYNLAASIAAQRPPWESSAILREELSTVISNRSTTLFELGDYLGALADAETVITIRRDWQKGHFRKAKALVGLGRLEEAQEAISLGLQFEPNNAVSLPSCVFLVSDHHTQELNGYMAELKKLVETRGDTGSKPEDTDPAPAFSDSATSD
jgi:tetratricopeptide (TPR) repeat protein